MTSIIEKRRSLHRRIYTQQQDNSALNAELTQLQALANMGLSTCMIAHEMINLLTPLSAYSALALRNLHDSDLTAKALGKVEKSCIRASKLLNTMVALVNGEMSEKAKHKLAPLVEEIFTSLCRDFKKDRINVKIDIPGDLEINAVTAQIQQVIMNLIINARHAMLAKGGKLTIQAAQTADFVTIEITDTGHGIAEADLPKIFEPFFTTKTSDKNSPQPGSGLGLAFCKKIINSHKGQITTKSNPETGTTFKITLPT